MNTIRLIELYLENKLEGQELIDFQERMKSDISFRNEIQLHREINESIIDDSYELRNQIKPLIPNPRLSVRKIVYLVLPLAAIFIIGFTLFSLSNKSETDFLYKSYYQPYDTDLNTRSNEIGVNEYKDAFLAYQNGDYQNSYDLLKKFTFDKVNYTVLFYSGLSALELNKLTEAEEYLLKVSISEKTLYSMHANWYLAMLYLKSDKPDEAQKYLEQLASTDNFYSLRAKKILRKLN